MNISRIQKVDFVFKTCFRRAAFKRKLSREWIYKWTGAWRMRERTIARRYSRQRLSSYRSDRLGIPHTGGPDAQEETSFLSLFPLCLFFFYLSFSQASAVANKEIDVPSFFLMNPLNSGLRRRGVDAPYVRSVKICALASRTGQSVFLCARWIFTGLLPVPRVVIERSTTRIYSESRFLTIWSRNFSDV